MKCLICNSEFGTGDNCQNCGVKKEIGLAPNNLYRPLNGAFAGGEILQPQQTTCFACSKTIPLSAKFCPYCSVKQYVNCPKCNFEYSAQYPCCPDCGTNREEYLKKKQLQDEIERAEKGDAEAQWALCYRFEFGKGVEQDYKKAVIWYTKAAEQGECDAQYNLGCCYYDGKGVSQDYEKAEECFAKYAGQDSYGQWNIGYFYSKKQDYEKAVKWYTKAAEHGEDAAQYFLGDCYYDGKGVEQDYEKAVEWFRKAAEQGHAEAQYSLGYCYYYGEGISQDYEKAVEWYTKAAKRGCADAQNNLGVCYENGDGVEKDEEAAVSWYRKAAEQGEAYAQYNLGWCYENGEGVKNNNEEAVSWYRKAADQGHVEAQYKLGCYYERKINFEEAKVWYKKAAEQGDEDAQNRLDIITDIEKRCERYNKTSRAASSDRMVAVYTRKQLEGIYSIEINDNDMALIGSEVTRIIRPARSLTYVKNFKEVRVFEFVPQGSNEAVHYMRAY